VEAASDAALPGPPPVDKLAFKPIVFDPPYERFASRLRDQAERSNITQAPGGLRVVAEPPVGAQTEVAATGRARQVGIRIPVDGMAAARFELELVDPEHVLGVHVRAESRSSRVIRWDWDRDPEVATYAFNGSITLVPGYPAHQLLLTASELRPEEVTSLDVFVTVDPAGHAGFELRQLQVARPNVSTASRE
jgi:hypothetical protein